MSALLQSLIYTAQRAGGAIMAVYATDFSVRDKADASPVTAADEADIRRERRFWIALFRSLSAWGAQN
jgi:3'-phosphoadenosine 5'-phosphosulfate (PAPS) 3'-phosphatase